MDDAALGNVVITFACSVDSKGADRIISIKAKRSGLMSSRSLDISAMVQIILDAMVNRLAALAQPHRLAVFRLLVVAGPDGRAAGEIAASFGLAASSLLFHLAHLKRAGLISVTRDGRTLRYAADFTAMCGLIDFLTESCCNVTASATKTSARPGDALGASLARNIA